MVDILVRAEDAPKINRIVERFKLTTVDAATVDREQEKITEIPVTNQKRHANPQKAQTERSAPSAPTSTMQKGHEVISEKRPSVRETIRELRDTRNKNAVPEMAKEVKKHIPTPKISAKPRER